MEVEAGRWRLEVEARVQPPHQTTAGAWPGSWTEWVLTTFLNERMDERVHERHDLETTRTAAETGTPILGREKRTDLSSISWEAEHFQEARNCPEQIQTLESGPPPWPLPFPQAHRRGEGTCRRGDTLPLSLPALPHVAPRASLHALALPLNPRPSPSLEGLTVEP